MSDIMLYGVLRMPYELAMSDEISRLQFYQRAQEAVDRLEACETTNTPSQVASIADDNEFHDALMKWLIDGDYSIDDGVLICKGWDALIAHIDAKLAQAFNDGAIEGRIHQRGVDDVRIQTAESRLAEIQRGVEGLAAPYEVSAFRANVRKAVWLDEVLALLAPQAQSATSGLPG